MPFDHEKLTAKQKGMEFPAEKRLSKRFGHTSAAREEVTGCGRPDMVGDLEQEQEQD